MSVMIEIYYKQPDDLRVNRIASVGACCNGNITFRESDSANSICLTAEFDSWDEANAATAQLCDLGEHLEGPCDYGDL